MDKIISPFFFSIIFLVIVDVISIKRNKYKMTLSRWIGVFLTLMPFNKFGILLLLKDTNIFVDAVFLWDIAFDFVLIFSGLLLWLVNPPLKNSIKKERGLKKRSHTPCWIKIEER